MPGIAGFAGVDLVTDYSETLDNMLAAIRHRDDGHRRTRIWSQHRCAVGTELLPHHDPDTKTMSDDRYAIFFDGEFYEAESPGSVFGCFQDVFSSGNYHRLIDRRGSFSAVCVDAAARRLFLCSDKLGTKPIFVHVTDDGIVFATELKAMLNVPGVGRKRCNRSYADFYRYGFVMGEKTLIDGIRLLPPATVVMFDLETRELTQDRYWSTSSLFSSSGCDRSFADVDNVAGSFVQAVDRRLGDLRKVGISLSGGLDSRAILAAMGDAAKGVPSYTLGLPGCEDERLTKRLADAAGTRHVFLPLGKDYLEDFEGMAETLVSYSDGLYHPHESTEKLALDYFCTQPFQIVLRGHAGELAKASLAYPLASKPELKNLTDIEQVTDYAYRQANIVLRDVDPAKLFSPEMAQAVEEGGRQSLQQAVSEAGSGLAPEDLCLYLYLTQWVRRQVFASLSIFRSQVEIRLPFLDEDFLQSLFALPVHKRRDGELQRAVVQKCNPRLMKIPNSNTGAPLDAGPLRLYVTDKLNSLLKRFSLPGFRHYTEFDRWQREYFRDQLEQIIFDERTLSRGLYLREGLDEVFKAHISGRGNHAFLLGTIVGLELWQRIVEE